MVVRTYSAGYEADLACQYLASHEIESIVDSADVGGQFPVMQGVEGVSVRVLPSDLDRASELLRELDLGSSDSSQPISTLQRVQGIVTGVLLSLLLLAFVFYVAKSMMD